MVSCVSQDGVGGCLPSPRSLGVLVPPGVQHIPVLLGAAKVHERLGRARDPRWDVARHLQVAAAGGKAAHIGSR